MNRITGAILGVTVTLFTYGVLGAAAGIAGAAAAIQYGTAGIFLGGVSMATSRIGSKLEEGYSAPETSAEGESNEGISGNSSGSYEGNNSPRKEGLAKRMYKKYRGKKIKRTRIHIKVIDDETKVPIEGLSVSILGAFRSGIIKREVSGSGVWASVGKTDSRGIIRSYSTFPGTRKIKIRDEQKRYHNLVTFINVDQNETYNAFVASLNSFAEGEDNRSRIEKVKDRVKEGINKAGDKVFGNEETGEKGIPEKIGNKINEKASHFKEYAQEKHEDLKDYSRDKKEQLNQYVDNKKEQLRETFRNKKGELIELYRDQSGKLRDNAGNLIDETKSFSIQTGNWAKETFINKKGELIELYRDQSGKLRDRAGNLIDGTKTRIIEGYDKTKELLRKKEEKQVEEEVEKVEDEVEHILNKDIELLTRLEGNIRKILLTDMLKPNISLREYLGKDENSRLARDTKSQKKFLIYSDIQNIKKIYPLLKKKILQDLKSLNVEKELKISEQHMKAITEKVAGKNLSPDFKYIVEMKLKKTDEVVVWLSQLNDKIGNGKEMRKEMEKIHDILKKEGLSDIVDLGTHLKEEINKVGKYVISIQSHVKFVLNKMKELKEYDIHNSRDKYDIAA